jgi:hypothetical protein
MPRRDPGPNVKDAELDEELRDQGASKERSARIANAADGDEVVPLRPRRSGRWSAPRGCRA